MHCPNCGHKATPTQNYCRSCGFSLEKFSDLFKEQSSLLKNDSSTVQSFHQRLIKYLAAAGGIAFIGGGSMFVIFFLYNIIAKMILERGQIYVGATLLLSLMGAVLLIVGAYYKESQKNRLPQNLGNTPPEIKDVTQTEKIFPASYSEGAASITERTTDLLEARNELITREKRSDGLRV